MVVAEFDVLRSEGEAYVRRLKMANVPVTLVHAIGLNHGFLKHQSLLPEAVSRLDAACDWLRRALAWEVEGIARNPQF